MEGINSHNSTRVGGKKYFAITTNSFLACSRGGIISVRTSGQETVIDEDDINPLTQFELPQELSEEVEKIIQSEGDWLDKTTQIRNVYEKYLYNLAPLAFDKYGKNKNVMKAMQSLFTSAQQVLRTMKILEHI